MSHLTIDDLFGPTGLFAESKGLAHRPGQWGMARAVGRALNDGGPLLAEAGTGTGKTLAYLAPAALSGRRVVISTATRALQTQILTKDVPLLSALLQRSLSVAVLKGRSNYLCLKQASTWIPDRSKPDEAAIDTWRSQTRTGDRAEVNSVAEDAPIWELLTVSSERCLGSRCPRFDTCYAYQARARAQAADLIIVNHHLYFGDLAVRRAGGAILPKHDAVIFDEAHAVPDIASHFFGRSVSSMRVLVWLRDARRSLKSLRLSAQLELDSVERRSERFFQGLRPAEGRRPWSPLEDGGAAEPDYLTLDDALAEAARALSREAGSEPELAALVRRAEVIRLDLAVFFEPMVGSSQVYYREARGPGAAISSRPVEPANRLRESLYSNARTVVFTSATLTIGGDFDYARERLGLPLDVPAMRFPSPFNYADQVRIYVPEHMPEPSDPNFINALAAEVRGLTAVTGGRAFILFTSHRNLNATYTALIDTVPYPLLRQGDAPRSVLLDKFRTTPGAVLLGTGTFWEGVDVAGDALSLVVIDRIPFGVPDDPVLQARMTAAQAAGADPFQTVQLPAAALALSQGVGRLIRRRTDRGLIALLDIRLMSRRYGEQLRSTLPPAPIIRTPRAVQGWWRAELNNGQFSDNV